MPIAYLPTVHASKLNKFEHVQKGLEGPLKWGPTCPG